LYLVLDRSSSMLKPLSGGGGISRLDVLRDTTRKFLAGDVTSGLIGRRDDMVGLIGFARVASVLAPLTLDHSLLLEKLDGFDVVQHRDEDGTALGYAIFKTANLIAATKHLSQDLIDDDIASYNIINTVMIVVTDGIQNPSPLDSSHPLRHMSLAEASRHAADHGVKTYIVNIEPLIRHPRYAASHKTLQDAVEITGGAFFVADDIESFHEIYAEIDALERSQLPGTVVANIAEDSVIKPSDLRRHTSYYPYLIGIGLTAFLLSLFFDAFIFRRTV